FESDNDPSASSATPFTTLVISNATIIGPIQNAGDVINSLYKRGANFKKNTQQNIHNSVIIGFPSGIMIDGSGCEGNADAGTLEVKNTILAGHTNNFEVAAGSTWDISSWFNTAGFGNSTLATSGDVMLKNPYNYSNPDLRPETGSPVLGAASFTDDDVSTGFTNVTYAGAFDGNVNWAACWTNWDPQNTDYSTPISGSITATTASFTYPSGSASLTITFENTSEGADEYFWDFGVSGIDTDTSTLETPTYTFPDTASYEVILIAAGCSADTTTLNVFAGTVAINDIDFIQSLAIYPNPAQNELNIQMFAGQNADATIQITDITGRVVAEKNSVVVHSGENSIKLDVSDLSNGMYMLNIFSETDKQSMKVIINK
ncbi:MAG: T9SS type A sorting domain-containing protein, partial [Fimbriimonadaceae bacterium]|nr:T9SS type A sorting domain-containing protein [Chitinophagales bacterium]